MSPEQLTNPAGLDQRSDIWSLGVILYECLSGKQPFTGSSFAQICALILQTEPEPLSARRPELPAPLVGAVERCLQKDRTLRFGSMLELARALAGHGSGRAQRALTVVEALVEARPPEPAQDDSPRPERPPTLDTGTLTAAGDRTPPSVWSLLTW